MEVTVKNKVFGRQKLDVYKSGKIVSSTGWHNNMVLDTAFESLTSNNPTIEMTSYDYHTFIVGSGTTPPQATDTTIESFIAGKRFNTLTENLRTNEGPSQDGLFNVFKHRRQAAFAEGEVVGNISELATIFHDSATTINGTTPVHTRSLVKDGLGNPTTITVNSDEQLVVTHELYVYVPNTVSSAVFNIDSTNYTINLVPVNFSSTTVIPLHCMMNPNNSAQYGGVRVLADDPNDTLTATPGLNLPRYLPNARYDGVPSAMNLSSAAVTEKTIDTVFDSAQANLDNGIGCGVAAAVSARGDFASWFFTITPNLLKTSAHKLTFSMKFEWARLS